MCQSINHTISECPTLNREYWFSAATWSTLSPPPYSTRLRTDVSRSTTDSVASSVILIYNQSINQFIDKINQPTFPVPPPTGSPFLVILSYKQPTNQSIWIFNPCWLFLQIPVVSVGVVPCWRGTVVWKQRWCLPDSFCYWTFHLQ